MNVLFTDAVLTRSLVLFLLLGSVAGIFAGSALLFRPGWILKLNMLAKHWISTRQMSRPLVRSYIIDSWFYRFNRLSGLVLMTGSVYIIYFFTAGLDKASMLNNVFKSAFVPASLMAGLFDALVLTCLTGAVLALIVSLFLLFRPSMLRDLESHANLETSLRQALKPLETQSNSLDLFILKHARIAGILILTGSVYTFWVMVNNL